MKRLSVEDKCFVLLASVYAAMRVYQFTDWSLTNDELSALMRLRNDSIGDLINLGVRENDMHPMGVQLLMWMWTGAFGISAWIVRLPFILMGVGALVFLYRAAGNFFGKPSALLASGIFAFLNYPAMYAELARPYSPGLFFSMLMLFGLSVLVKEDSPRKWTNAIAFFIGGVGCMYS
ncbi:MAG: glycosyltransferase family 39 protein, partial [Bacteroidota bacterium]